MTTSNKILRSIEEQKQQDLASLELLSRDLDTYLKGPKEVKVKAAPKYVTGVTKSQGDEEYASNIRAFGSKQLARAFGMNMGMSAIQQDILNKFESRFGSGSGTREFVDLATQVACHMIMQSAVHAGDGGTAKTNLPNVKTVFVNGVETTKSIKGGLEALRNTTEAVGEIKANVYKWLRPLNLVHVERVDARFSPRLRSRDDMMDYIVNGQARRAVDAYIVDHSVPDDVLVPLAFASAVDKAKATAASGSTAAVTLEQARRAALADAFEMYPGKDVASTFMFYSKAVKANLDTRIGLQVGDVNAYLSGAVSALRDASKALSTTGISASVRKIFKNGFDEAASKLSRINPTSTEADEDIAFVAADLGDLLGAYSGIGSGTATRITTGGGKLNNAFSGTLATRVATILGRTPSRYDSSSAFTENSIEYLDARDEICPKDVNNYGRRVNPRFQDVVKYISIALINMDGAHSLLVPAFEVATADKPTGLTQGTLNVTQAFADLVANQLKVTQNYLHTQAVKTLGATTTDEYDLFKKAMLETYEQLLGIDPTAVTDLTTDPTVAAAGNGFEIDNWGVKSRVLNQIANGTVPTFRSAGLEQIIINIMNGPDGRALTSTNRRKVRDFTLRAAKMFSDALQTLRAQAENTNIAIQTRSNPAMSKGQMALTGTGSLVGTHAMSAIANRFLQPGSGTMKAHLADYAPSLAVAGYGIIKANKGEKDLGYSLAGGAVAHMGLRYLFSCCPSLRFSENPVLKALQAPTNGLAHLIGDESMAASALTPASIEGKTDVGGYVLGLVNANDCPSLCYIARQLCKSGLSAGTGQYSNAEPMGDLDFVVGGAVADPKPADCAALACQLVRLKCVVNAFGLAAVSESRKAVDSLVFRGEATVNGENIKFKAAARSEECKKALAECKERMSQILNVKIEDLSGFILEPGYNMNVYSGEDQVSYLQPAPQQTAQPAIVQLEDAIARARQLGPQEKLQEGIDDLQDVAIIRANPSMARDIEAVGLGTSLGRSRMNPGHELVALEVEGANGLWPVAPARQQSVPQGALNYAKIGPATDVTVSPEGLFNRGVFKPMFGR